MIKTAISESQLMQYFVPFFENCTVTTKVSVCILIICWLMMIKAGICINTTQQTEELPLSPLHSGSYCGSQPFNLPI